MFIKKKLASLLRIILLLSSWGLFACFPDSRPEEAFNLLYPNCVMNTDLMFLPLQPNYKTGKLISLSYKNNSQHQIAYYPSKDIKILSYDTNTSKWEEIKNNLEYHTSPLPYKIIGTPNDNYGGTVISPDVLEESKEMRVVLIGYLYKDNIVTDQCVGAFIDIKP